MSNMTIDVEFLAGTEIKEAITEAKAKARLLDVAYIKFNFNGVSFSIGQDADVEEAIDVFHTGNTKYGICSA